jgi:hypothetical protein
MSEVIAMSIALIRSLHITYMNWNVTLHSINIYNYGVNLKFIDKNLMIGSWKIRVKGLPNIPSNLDENTQFSFRQSSVTTGWSHSARLLPLGQREWELQGQAVLKDRSQASFVPSFTGQICHSSSLGERQREGQSSQKYPTHTFFFVINSILRNEK